MKLSTSTTTFLFTFVIFSCCVILASCDSSSSARSGSPSAAASPKKLRGLGPSANRLFHLLRLGILCPKKEVMGGANIDDEDLQSDDDNFVQKRQYDDYGHMRFGKRNPSGKNEFDDYGHLRFGK